MCAMRRSVSSAIASILIVVFPCAAAAQTVAGLPGRETRKVLVDSPIYIAPDTPLGPLATLTAGTEVTVRRRAADWTQVEFEDSQWGLRIGYIRTDALSPPTPTPPPSVTDDTAGLTARPPNPRVAPDPGIQKDDRLRPAPAADGDLSMLLRRAGDYVRSYHETLTTVVAEELYVQGLTRPNEGRQERVLKSEFALVRGAPGDDLWLAIRDVVEVDGQRVAGSSKLDDLLRDTRGNLRTHALAIATEQAKYNLGDVFRTINVPTLPLEFLLPDRQRRFRFKRAGSATVAGIEAAAVTYEERSHPTIIRTPNGRDVVAKGTMWLDPRNGQVLKTELMTAGPQGVRSVIDVTYGFEARLGMLVPAQMTETYTAGDVQITGTANYSNFRRFETESRIVR